MIILTGSASGPKRRELFAQMPRNFGSGCMYGPASFCPPWTNWWALDNDAWSHRNDLEWWDREGETAWLKMLDKAAPFVCRGEPIFAVLPDVVGDWDRTLERAHFYRQELRDRKITAAVALQNGCDDEEEYQNVLRLDCPAVFVGGTTRWKWLNVEPLRRRFEDKHLHVGRVNGPCQIRECIRVGVDSVDGTGWSRFSRKMLPPLLAALNGTYKAETGRLEI